MSIGRAHRVQARLPIHLSVPGQSRALVGETLDISSRGFAMQAQGDASLPKIVFAEILPPSLRDEPLSLKARRVWQGGISRGVTRASYHILSISAHHQRELDRLIRRQLRGLIADLGDLPLFAGIDVGELEYLLTLARVRDGQAGKTLYEAGKCDGAGVYLVLDGRVGLQRSEKETGLGRGRVFGQWALPAACAHAEGARIQTAARYLYLPAAFHREVATMAPATATVLREALGALPRRSSSVPACGDRTEAISTAP